MGENGISILGSTGSIGTQTVEVAKCCNLPVHALVANHNVDLLEQQARQLHPKLVAAADRTAAAVLKERLADTDICVMAGEEGVLEAATLSSASTVVTALVGIAGLRPTLAAIEAGKRIALANKETLVCAGPLVMEQAKKHKAQIIPVDSEHSAIFQCLQGAQDAQEIKRLLLTASGGPFFGYSKEQLAKVTLEQALKHPNWTMGAKVTIDSATLMNKGLEFLEAMALFGVEPDGITVLVHRESIVHSAVEFCDNSVLAQMGAPDMRVPIQYALTYPKRVAGPGTPLDLFDEKDLTFTRPDLEAFPCLALAMRAAREGGIAPALLNGANEVAVARFLNREIGFLDIPRLVEAALSLANGEQVITLDDVFAADKKAREIAQEIPAQYLAV